MEAIIANLSPFVIVLFVIGFGLMTVEMFMPGFGVPGVLGGIFLILGVVFTAESVTQAIILIAVVLVILGIMFTIVLVKFAKGDLNYMILKEKQDKDQGYIGTEDLNYFVGKEGVTTSVLRPSGVGEFDGVKMDIVADGEFIDSDVKVKIIKVQGRRIVVKQIKNNKK